MIHVWDAGGRIVRARGFVAAALLALCIVAYGNALLALHTGILSAPGQDGSEQFVYWRQFAAQNLLRGHIAQWDPHVFSGTPFFGQWQSAILYPPNWLYLLLPIKMGILADAFASTFLAGWFTSLLAAKYRFHPIACLLAGAAVMFGGGFFGHVWPGHLTALAAMAWAPLALLAAEELLDRPSAKWIVVGAAAVAMQVLAGHPQTVFNTAVIVALYAVARWMGRPHKARTAAALIAMAAGGACLSAVQLLTGLDVASEGIRSAHNTFQFVSEFSLPPENLITLAAPFYFGDLKGEAYWGRTYYWEATAFVGAAILSLALLGVVRARLRRRFLWAALAALALAIALGSHAPLLYALYRYAPGFTMFRAPNRFIFEANLFVALLAASGLDVILRGERAGRLAVGAAVAVAVAIGAAGAIMTRPDVLQRLVDLRNASNDIVVPAQPPLTLAARHASIASVAAAFVIAVCVVLVAALSRRSRRWGYALAGIALCELTGFAHALVTTFDIKQSYPPILEAWYRYHPGWFRVLQLVYPANSAISLGGQDIWGYDAAGQYRYFALLSASQGQDLNHQLVDSAVTHPSPFFKSLGCRYALIGYHGGLLTYDIAGALPPAAMIYRYEVMPDQGLMFAAVLGSGFDAARIVALERAPGVEPAAPAAPPVVSLRWLDSDTLRVDVATPTPGILLVNESYSRFWHAAALAGSAQAAYTLQPANYVQIAIPVEAGSHHIRLRYQPDHFAAGAVISLISAIVAIAAWFSPASLLARKSRP